MERLTHPRNSGIKTGYWSPNKKDELVERLAAYEDTGLTPEEIERLKEQHRWIPVEERLEVCSDICDNYCKYRDTVDEDGNCEAVRTGLRCPLDRLN